MRVAVLGGAGQTGRCAVRALAESKEVTSGIVGDIDGDAASRTAESIGRGKFDSSRVDVSDADSTAKVLAGCDVVVNGVQYYFNMQVMSSALKARCSYLDFGGLYHTTLKQLALDSEFRRRGLTAIVGMGGQPGVTNILSRHAADSLDSVSTIAVRDGAVDLTKGVPPFLVTWSLDTFLDELTLPAPVFEEGRTITVPPLSRSDDVRFPSPVGLTKTYCTIHSEVATLPQSFRGKGVKNVDWMEGVTGLALLRGLVDLGFASKEELSVGQEKISPRRFLLKLVRENGLMGFPEKVVPDDWETTAVFVDGTKDGRSSSFRYDVTIPPLKDWKMSCAQSGVGIPASIVARMIGRGDVKKPGVSPPETAVRPAPFVKELRSYGFKVSVKKGSRPFPHS